MDFDNAPSFLLGHCRDFALPLLDPTRWAELRSPHRWIFSDTTAEHGRRDFYVVLGLRLGLVLLRVGGTFYRFASIYVEPRAPQCDVCALLSVFWVVYWLVLLCSMPWRWIVARFLGR